MRRAAKKDIAHNDIATYLDANGWDVHDTSAVGGGLPDLLVGRPGFCALLEIKSDPKISHRPAKQLTPAQVTFRANWRGPYAIATTGIEALERLNELWYRSTKAI